MAGERAHKYKLFVRIRSEYKDFSYFRNHFLLRQGHALLFTDVFQKAVTCCYSHLNNVREKGLLPRQVYIFVSAAYGSQV